MPKGINDGYNAAGEDQDDKYKGLMKTRLYDFYSYEDRLIREKPVERNR